MPAPDDKILKPLYLVLLYFGSEVANFVEYFKIFGIQVTVHRDKFL